MLAVPEGSNAKKAGLLGTERLNDGNISVGDIIVGMNGDSIDNEMDLFRCLEDKEVGQEVKLQIVRRKKIEGSGVFPERIDVPLVLSLSTPPVKPPLQKIR